MFDASFLPPASFEFVVIADTHYMIDPKTGQVEFASRRLQTMRAEQALRAVAALQTPLIIHMGDLVQEFPERANFEQAVDEACAQLARCGLQPRIVAGNHDIGDKPDPTMPASPVTPQFLANYHARFGPSWYSWDEGDLHFIVLNSQIMNSDLPEAVEQQRWFEADLAAHGQQRTFLFLHLPPFLKDEQEPALGHYDNVDEPARSWLLELVRRYRVEWMFAAHVHYLFYNEVDKTRYLTTPSVAFSRPGFGELFSSTAPPDQGRDDAAKLGFFLVRVQADGTRVHLIRTGGVTERPTDAPTHLRLLTRTSPDLPASPLGVVLHHPLAHEIDVPSVWPSTIRQPVRNDYPLWSCLELGVRHLRVPATDLDTPLQASRLAMLRREGAQLHATWLWQEGMDLAPVQQAAQQIDCAELRLVGSLYPSPTCLAELRQYAAQIDIPVRLSPVVPGRQIPGKQHARTQTGYQLDDLEALNRCLAQADVQIDRVLCRIEATDDPWTLLASAAATSFSHIGALDWVLELTPDHLGGSHRAAAALFAAALWPNACFFFEPLIDLDRTMDTAPGLLDRLCNPHPTFHLLRHLNTLLFREDRHWRAQAARTVDQARILQLSSDDLDCWLVLPAGECHLRVADLFGEKPHLEEICRVALVSGMCRNHRVQLEPGEWLLDEPTLLYAARNGRESV